MNNQPHQKLCELINTYGQSLCDNPRRCEGLLRDFCGEHKREIFVLISALKERVAADLLYSSPSVPHGVLLAQLTKRLCDNLGLSEDAAKWSVESWAMALGVISSAGTKTHIPKIEPSKVEATNRRPGGAMSVRPLHFIWIADCSGSMGVDGKIKALNTAIREAIPHMQEFAEDNPNANVLVRAIKFSRGAQWYIEEPTPIVDFKWMDLSVEASFKDMGRALVMVTDALTQIPQLALAPFLVLLSDGRPPTDDFESGLKALNALLDQRWSNSELSCTRPVRCAVAIGEDADHDVLQKFIGHPERKPLQPAESTDILHRYYHWYTVPIANR